MKESEFERAIELYRRATELYQGEYLLDCPYTNWAIEERERFLALYLLASEDLASLLLEQGNANETITLCHHILDQDPLWEAAYRLLMFCHWQQGNRSVALRTYQRCTHRLKESLGIEPALETNKLYQKILSSEFSL